MKRLNRIMMGTLLCTLMMVPSAASGERTENILQGISHAQDQKYAIADSFFSLVEDEHPAGYFFKAFALQSRMTHENDYRKSDSMHGLCKLTIHWADSLIRHNPESHEGYFYMGLGHGMLSTYYEKAGALFSALKRGLKGIDYLEKSLTKNPTLFDAYAGIGIYHYWKGKFTRFLDWLPFVEDEREKGKQELLTAMQKGAFLNDAARYSLIWVHYQEGSYAESERLINAYLQAHPDNMIFLRARADVYFQVKNWEGACSDYEMILQNLKINPTKGGIQESECRFKLALSYEKRGDRDAALAAYKAVIETQGPGWARKKTEDHRNKSSLAIKRLE